MKATQIVHWPGKDTPACDRHAQGLNRLAGAMGFALAATPCEIEAECTNCANEEKKELERIARL